MCLSPTLKNSDGGNVITRNTEESAEKDCYVPSSVLSASHSLSMGCGLLGQSA